MGACFDELDLDGNLSRAEVEKKFKAYQNECDHESGHSYSGRLNMCRGLEFAYQEFNSRSEASDHLDKTCQKWENAIAVRYKDSNNIEADAKLKRLSESYKDLESKIYTLEREFSTAMEQKLRSVEFIKCPNCKSHMDTRFRQRTLKCPICEGSFLSKTDLNKLVKLRAKLADISAKAKAHREVLQAKADKKPREWRWLIGGLCSS